MKLCIWWRGGWLAGAILTVGAVAADQAIVAQAFAAGGYKVTGEVEGFICSGWVVKACSLARIDASSYGEGLSYLPEIFETVDETRDGRCWIQVHSGPLNWALGDVPTFYHYKAGPRHLKSSYEELDTPDYITFACQAL